MPDYVLRPDGTVSNNYTISGAASAHAALADAVTDPAAPSTATDFISTTTTNNACEVALADLAPLASGETVSAIAAKTYASTSGTRRAQRIELFYNVGGTGANTSLGFITLGQNSAAAWREIAASTANLTLAEINSLRLRFSATTTTSTSTGTASAFAAYVVVTTTIIPKTETLVDDCSGTDPLVKWPGSSGPVSYANGEGVGPLNTSFRSAAVAYDLRGSHVRAKMLEFPTGAGSEAYVGVWNAGASRVLHLSNANGFVYCGEVIDGTWTGQSETIPYDAAVHRYFQIRHDQAANLVHWETSATGLAGSWTTHRSKTPGWDISRVTVVLLCTAGGAGQLRWDDFNVVVDAGGSRSASDSFTISDSAARVGARTRQAADALAISDTATRGPGGRARSASDTVVLSDTATRAAAGRQRTTAESFAITDQAVRAGAARARGSTDAFAVTDQAAGTPGLSRTGADAFAVSDQATRSTGRARTAADSVIVSDSAARAVAARTRAASDTFSVSDQAAGVKGATGLTASASDSFTIADAATRAPIPRTRSAQDAYSVSDSAARSAARARSTSDSFTISDTAGRASTGRARSAGDAFAITDTAGRSVTTRQRAAGDSFTFTDTATRSGARARGSADTFAIGDVAARGVWTGRIAEDSFTFTDSAQVGSHSWPAFGAPRVLPSRVTGSTPSCLIAGSTRSCFVAGATSTSTVTGRTRQTRVTKEEVTA